MIPSHSFPLDIHIFPNCMQIFVHLLLGFWGIKYFVELIHQLCRAESKQIQIVCLSLFCPMCIYRLLFTLAYVEWSTIVPTGFSMCGNLPKHVLTTQTHKKKQHPDFMSISVFSSITLFEINMYFQFMYCH